MIFVNSIANALFTQIASDSFIVGSEINVQLEPDFNSDGNLQNWVGIYHADTTLEPKRLNIHKPWIAHINFNIFAQGGGYNAREEAINNANAVTQVALSAVNCNRQFNIGGTVYTLFLNGFTPFDANNDLNNGTWTNGISLYYELFQSAAASATADVAGAYI